MREIVIPMKGEFVISYSNFDVLETKTWQSKTWANTYHVYTGQILEVTNSIYMADPLVGKLILRVAEKDKVYTFGSKATENGRQMLLVPVAQLQNFRLMTPGDARADITQVPLVYVSEPNRWDNLLDE